MITTKCDLLWLADKRKTDSPQVWVSGCSFADGHSVDKNQRYGQIVADSLGKEVSFLSILGASIPWSADQILRSDIRKGDIVIWGLTGISRYLTFKNNIFVNVLPETFRMVLDPIKMAQSDNEDREQVLNYYTYYQPGVDSWSDKERTEMEANLLSGDRLMQAVQGIHQVDNYCAKVGATLVIFLHELSIADFYDFVNERISDLESYLHIHNQIDKGNNGTHPGPNTHRLWADDILQFLKEKNID